jgi:hypothetical protein
LCLVILISFSSCISAQYSFSTTYGNYRSSEPRYSVPTAFSHRAVPAVPAYKSYHAEPARYAAAPAAHVEATHYEAPRYEARRYEVSAPAAYVEPSHYEAPRYEARRYEEAAPVAHVEAPHYEVDPVAHVEATHYESPRYEVDPVAHVEATHYEAPRYEADPVARVEDTYYDAPRYEADPVALVEDTHYNNYADPATYAVPSQYSSQYHAQDELGQVNYGYSNVNSQKQETRDAFGNVVGAYSYIDASGVTRTVRYIADEHGFRVTGANNLPVAPLETPEVAHARAAHFRALAAVGFYP